MSKYNFERKIVQEINSILGYGTPATAGKLSPRPELFSAPYPFLLKAQSAALTDKNPWFFEDKVDTHAAALDGFWATERHCYEMNTQAFPNILKNNFKARTFIECVRHYVYKVLGEFSISDASFGPGASSALAASSADLVTKLGTLPECTPLAHRDVLLFVLDRMPHYALSSGLVSREKTAVKLNTTKLPLVSGSRFTTVPKTALTDRCIACEPLGNMLVQRGIGVSIETRLREWGLVLSETPLKHKAYLESNYQSLATIDLRSASDTIYTELVRFLLPYQWFEVMNRVRSHSIKVEGRDVLTEKFSTMGNGFTFELETLIFHCFQLANRELFGSKDQLISTFGDDILCDCRLAETLIFYLELFGFMTNPDKTFIDGPFRESCGFDYFAGTFVRPVFFRDLPTNKLARLYALHNRVMEIAGRVCIEDGYFDKRFRHILASILEMIAKRGKIIFGPTCIFGDAVLYPHSRHTVHRRSKYYARVSRRKKLPTQPDHLLACALYGLPSSGLVTRRHAKCYTMVVRHSRTPEMVIEPIWV